MGFSEESLGLRRKSFVSRNAKALREGVPHDDDPKGSSRFFLDLSVSEPLLIDPHFEFNRFPDVLLLVMGAGLMNDAPTGMKQNALADWVLDEWGHEEDSAEELREYEAPEERESRAHGSCGRVLHSQNCGAKRLGTQPSGWS